MDSTEFQKYLKERYFNQVNWYDKKAQWNQKIYKRFHWALIVLSAIAPVLFAINIDETRWPAILVSALVAIGTTAIKTFKYQENWINYRTTCETLRKEIYFYNAKIGDYKNSKDPESVFIERVEALISRENTMWLTTQKTKIEKTEPKS